MSSRRRRLPGVHAILAAAAALVVASWPAAPGRVHATDPAEQASASATADDVIAAGDALYAADDFAGAADAYADAAALGELDGARAVRLGNAYVRLGRPGRAMAAYRLAEAASPRDPALRANIAWLRDALASGAASPAAPSAATGGAAPSLAGEGASGAAGGTGAAGALAAPDGDAQAAGAGELPAADRETAFAPGPRRGWSLAWWAAASRAWWSLDGLSAFVLGAWWVAVLALWAGRVGSRRWARSLAGGALGVALLAGVLLGARIIRRAAAVPAIVVEPGLSAVRQGPGMPFAAVRSVPEGAEVRYVERRGRWLRLADEGGGAGGGGWIAAASVVDVPE